MIFLRRMSEPLETRYRLMGLLPLAFFAVQAIHYWRFGGMGHLLWMCNAGNVLLGVGLLLSHRELIRAAAIWTIPGLVVWVIYVLLPSGFYFSTTLAHVGGFVVGLIALRRVGMDRTAWIYAFAWYLFTQVAARLLTPAELNVNVSHRVQDGWNNAFTSYWKFWLVAAVATAFVLWAIGRVVALIWPVKSATERRPLASESEIQA
jgi:hypothetical protein